MADDLDALLARADAGGHIPHVHELCDACLEDGTLVPELVDSLRAVIIAARVAARAVLSGSVVTEEGNEK